MFDRFGGGEGAAYPCFGRIVGAIAEVLATGYHILTEILRIVECIDRLMFGISSDCVETLVPQPPSFLRHRDLVSSNASPRSKS